MEYVSDPVLIREHSQRIIASGVLGRSKINLRLFKYLVERSIDGSAPKELEIAIDVFDKQPDFDVGHDSLVRVYIYKLRRKINEYYRLHRSPDKNRISIPKGQYRFAVTAVNESPGQDIKGVTTGQDVLREKRLKWLSAILVLSLILNIFLLFRSPSEITQHREIPAEIVQHPLWSNLLDDDLPVTILLGDYFIFAELDDNANVRRLVRDFSVNSAQDLDNLLLEYPDLSMKYLNVDLNYLPVGSASALKDILPVLEQSGKKIDIKMMSEFNVNDLKSGHLLYIGYISALDKLTEFVFAASELSIADTYDELINQDTGETYYSEAGILPFDNSNYRDYGLLSTFPGPVGNQVIIISGTRDEGLMQTAHAVSTPEYLKGLDQSLPHDGSSNGTAFEALYEVIGLDRTGLDANLIYTAPLNYRTIWGAGVPD